MRKMRIYFASAMTGRSGKDLIAQSNKVGFLAYYYKVEALDPIKVENVKEDNKLLNNGGDLLKDYWKRDKEMVRRADVLIDVTGPAKSEGVAHEIAIARYHFHKPVVRVWPGLDSSIARLEDDVITDTIDSAIKLAVYRWGTPWKRLKWKIMICRKSYLKLLIVRLRWFIDWI